MNVRKLNLISLFNKFVEYGKQDSTFHAYSVKNRNKNNKGMLIVTNL